MPSNSNMNRELAKAFLEISETDWESLTERGVARDLVTLIPFVLEYQDNLEDAKKFFLEMKEIELVKGIDSQLDSLDQVRLGIIAVVEDPSLSPKEVKQLLAGAYEDLTKAFTEYAKLEAATVEAIRTRSKGNTPVPKISRILKKVRSYWNHIDEFWPNEREAVLGKWDDYFKRTDSLLRSAVSSLRLPNSPHETLLRVESLLKKRASYFAAQKANEARDNIKQYYVEEYGLIPAYMGAKGNWKVEKDDCPEPRLPEFNTNLTERFAFCRVDEKSCPSFDWSTGSYVRCKSFVRLKEAGLISGIREVDDKDFIESLEKLAESDPFLQMLFQKADRGDGRLFWGELVDNRLETMLEQYPKSDRKGNQGIYTVYLVASEPVFVSGGRAVAADKVLLETIGEGERMPKTATTMRVAGPMMRLTFTANALRDPEFRDFLNKKKAIMSNHWTWDIPFEKEDDIGFILAEIKEEFGYPISVFEVLEDAESLLQRNFNIRDFSKLPVIRHSSALLYMPKVDRGDVPRNTVSLSVAEKLVDVANNLNDSPLKSRVACLADNLRVARRFIIATHRDIVVYADGAIGLVPEPGMKFRVKDPDTGNMVPSEVTEVLREKKGSPKKGITYKVRTLDTGKEIELKRPWLKPFNQAAAKFISACGCGEQLPPPDEMLPEAPPLGYFPGGDGQMFIFRLPSPSAEMAPPGPPGGFGRFPGEGGPPPPDMMPPPMMDMMAPPPPMMDMMPPPDMMAPPPPVDSPFKFLTAPSPFGPGGSPLSEAPAPMPMPGPPPALEAPRQEHGPVSEGTQVFAPVDDPQQMDEAAEQKVIDKIKKKTKPGLKFTNIPRDPVAPSGAPEEEIEEAISKLKDLLKEHKGIKDVRRDLTPGGKPVLFVHTSVPESLEDQLPDSINGFEVRIAPRHSTLVNDEEPTDREAGDSLVDPLPNRPENGHPRGPELEAGPYLKQLSGPPPMGMELNRQTRDIPKR